MKNPAKSSDELVLELQEMHQKYDSLKASCDHDNTEFKQTIAILQENVGKFRAIYENTNDIINRFDRQYRHLLASPSATKITGLPNGAFLGKSHRELGFPEEFCTEWENAIEIVFTTGKAYKTKVEFDGITGKVYLDWLLNPEFDDNRNVKSVLGIARDITDLILAEQKEQNTQILLQSNIESPLDMIILSIDINFNYLYFNTFHKNTMSTAYGKKVDAGMNMLDCITNDDDRTRTKNNFSRALSGENHLTIEEYGETTRYYYETRYSPIFNDKNEIIGATAFSTNVTERILAAEAIKKSEEKYRSLFETMQEFLIIVEVINDKSDNPCDYRYISLNPSAEQISGSTKELIIGHTYRELTPIVNPEVIATVGKVSLTGEPMSAEWFSYPKKRWIRQYLHRIAPGQVILLGVDITDRKQAELRLEEKNFQIEIKNKEYQQINEELVQTNNELLAAKEQAEESEETYRLLFNSISDVILVAQLNDDQSFNFVNVNNIACERYGYTREEFLTKTPNDIISENGKKTLKEMFKKLLNNEFPLYETEHVKKNGQTFPVEISTRNTQIRNKTIFNAIVRDITERKKYEIELIKAKEHAEENDHLKTAFLHNISHELRTPMNAIMGFSKLVVLNFNNKPKLERFEEIITQSCNDLLDIIDDILDIAKIEAGQLSVNEDECDLDNLFGELSLYFQKHQNRINKQGINFSLNAQLGSSKIVMVTDKVMLKQIFINIINNAFKFTDTGTIEGGCKFDDSKNLIFYVSDTGIGIAPNKHEIIFEHFTQLDKGINRLYGGTGLGLSIVKGFVGLLGGRIWLESEPGKGSTFYFTFPLQIIQQLSDKPLTTEVNTKFHFPGKTILIVEDDNFNMEYLKEIIIDTGVDILYAENGREAIQIATLQTPDLVLMDIRLPDMDGYQVTSEIRKQKPHLKIIAQTAYASITDRQKAFNEGFNDYISKPISRDMLLSLLKKHLS